MPSKTSKIENTSKTEATAKINQTTVDQHTIECKKVQFKAEDGYVLSGYQYLVQKNPVRAQLIMANATGVPQAFYRRFAEYMTQYGYQVLTFDYRGIGESKPETLKGFKMSYLDWGQKDLAAAIEFIANQQLPIFMVGHSYGGHALGLLPNHDKITAFYCFGTGAGWAGYMPKLEALKVRLMWNVVFPIMVKKAGYLPWSKFKLGEDLPLGAYLQWRKWCKKPQYCFADPEYQFLKQKYASVKIPTYAAVALDDAWALPPSRDAFMKYYTQADLHLIDLEPRKFNIKEIGHMGYFRTTAQPIWDTVVQTFEQYLPNSA